MLPDLSQQEKLVFQNLSHEPLNTDGLCNQMKKDTPEILSTLLMLELKNLVQQHSRELFTRSIWKPPRFYVICLMNLCDMSHE